jgi:PTS system nitrogen regulatory IIA component
MSMEELFAVERMLPRLRARDERGALRKLASVISGRAERPGPAAVRSVIESAELSVLSPASGVVLLHAVVGRLREPLAAVARLDPPLRFDGSDGSPADLLVLLLSPAGRASDHLRSLAAVARRLRAQGVRDRLRAAESGDEMYVVLVDEGYEGEGGDALTAPGSDLTFLGNHLP